MNDGGPASEATLRDLFAAKAMQGIMTMREVSRFAEDLNVEKDAIVYSKVSYIIADAMLSHRQKLE